MERGKPLERATQTMVGALFVTEMNGTMRQFLLQIDDYPNYFAPCKIIGQNMAYRKSQLIRESFRMGGFFYHYL